MGWKCILKVYNDCMNSHEQIKEIEHHIRSSLTYHEWQRKNLTQSCIVCESTENIQVHHIIELYHIILGLWKLYGNKDDVICHALALHADDKCENVTLCKNCHKKTHPGRRIAKNEDVRIEDWTVLPRTLPGPFLHNSKVADERGLTVVSAQILAGFGWLILGGQIQDGIIEFRRSSMAQIINKRAGKSFNNSIERALDGLRELDVILGWNISKADVEVHLSKTYLDTLTKSPWFMSMQDVKTSNMTVFALRWLLCTQSGKHTYRIGLKKLAENIGLKTTTPVFVEQCIRKAISETKWASVDFDGNCFAFRIRWRGPVPIWSLRSIVVDAVSRGK